jgi:hypothetical protein
MNIQETNNLLKQEAIKLGLCEQWQNEVWTKDMSVEELIELYLRGIDFCIEHHWPANEMIKRLVSVDDRRKNCILVDDAWSLLNPQQAILLGASRSVVRCNGRAVTRLFVRDKSLAHLSLKGHCHVIVDVYDSSTIQVDMFEPGCRLLICQHSSDVKLAYTLNEGIDIKNLSFS